MQRTFAVIEKGIVANVIVGPTEEEIAANPGKYVEYSPTIPAGIGWTWDGTAFTPPRPYPSWILNKIDHLWEPPVPYPVADGKSYLWDEASVSWVAMV